jgi:YbbR domain-containing protein
VTWVSHNFRLKLLSVFLALTTWGIVAYAGNPPQSVTFQIKAEHGVLPADLVLLHEPPPITVTVAGLQSSIASFKKESVRASIDVSAVHPGTNKRLKVTVDSPSREATVRDVQPSQVDVEVDRLTAVTRKVDVRLQGQPDSCCLLGTPSVTPDSVSLRGPQSLLASATPFALVEISGRQASVLQQPVQVKVETPDHKVLSEVSPTPQQVAASVPITLNKQQRSVPIVLADVTGQPAPGFQLVGLTDQSPLVVLIQGNQDVIAPVVSIGTEPVDISGLNGDSIRTLTLRPPPGIEVVTKGPYTVKIHIVPLARPSPSPGPSPSPTI